MVVLALAAIVLAIGAPSFTEFRRNNRLTSAANDMLAAVHLARTEAIKRQRPVAVCPSANPETDAGVCSGGEFSGWIVFEDTDNDCDRDAGEDFLRGDGPLDATVSSESNGTCISFAATGFLQLQAVTGVAEATTTVFCDERGIVTIGGTGLSAARGVELQFTGRPRVQRENGVINGWGLACP